MKNLLLILAVLFFCSYIYCDNRTNWIEIFDSYDVPDSSSCTNDVGRLAWTASQQISAFIRMYQATQDIDYINECINRIDNVISQLDTIRNVTSYLDEQNEPVIIPTWRSYRYSVYKDIEEFYGNPKDSLFAYHDSLWDLPNGPDYGIPEDCFAYPWVVHSGKILLPIVQFITLVDEYLYYDRNYVKKRDYYLTIVKQVIVAHDDQWINDSSVEGHYQLRTDISPNLLPSNWQYNQAPHNTLELPKNMQNIMGSVLVLMSGIQRGLNNFERQEYLRKATKLANRFKNLLYSETFPEIPDSFNSYIWNYWGVEYKSTGHWYETTGEDISHATINIEFANIAYKAGIVFNYEDMRKFARTFTNFVFISIDEDNNNDYNLSNYVDGTIGSKALNEYRYAGDNWLPLCEYNPSIYTLVEQYMENHHYWEGASFLSLYNDTNGYYDPTILKGDDLLCGFNSINGGSIYMSNTATSIGNRIEGPYNLDDPEYKNIRFITSGDFNGDSNEEFVAAFQDRNLYSELWLSETGTSLTERFFISNLYNIDCITTCDLDNNGMKELVAITSFISSGNTYLWSFDVYDGSYDNLCTLPILEQEKATSICVGNFDSNPSDDIFISIKGSNGKTPYSKIIRSYNGYSDFEEIYYNDNFTIPSIIAEDIDGNGDDELITVFNNVNNYSDIYYSDTGNSIGTLIYGPQYEYKINTIIIGDFDGDENTSNELVMGCQLYSEDAACIRKSNDLGSTWTSIYGPNTNFTITSLTCGDYVASTCATIQLMIGR